MQSYSYYKTIYRVPWSRL